MSSASQRDPVAHSNTKACSISSKMTFTFNINLNGTSPAETVGFVVNNTSDTAETCSSRLYPNTPTRAPSGRSRKLLSRAQPIITARKPFRTPRKSGTNDRVVLETPDGMLASDMPPRKKQRLTESQEANTSDSPQSDFNASEIEGSVSEYHANEPVAVFSPSCQAHAEDREVLLFAHVVQLLELFKKNEKMELWVISQDLDRKIVTYVKAFVSPPTTVSYRGLNVGEHILKAMCECKVKSLPNDDDTAANNLVLARIREKCTHYQNVYKSRFKESTAKDSPLCNIAALSYRLAENSGIKATVQLYQRVALVYPDLEDDEFWPKAVDHTINQFRKRSSNQEELDLCFNAIYEDDKKLYGDPASTEFKAADINQGPAWQVTLGKHAQNIQFAPQAPSGPPTKKHKVALGPEEDSGSDNDRQ
ncbi:hypothetical protein DFH08DRAFT_1043608 [Mycena albidolilacea]|uniref:Uncharacterized protein n=1 Tax=Mycena albidolilacea TaxID=1033008 RepID=A0AAD7AHC4_9AGAR|nr:hypothetical protein DFH08DRAFT_1043608 [Mycena albidolilacea]